MTWMSMATAPKDKYVLILAPYENSNLLCVYIGRYDGEPHTLPSKPKWVYRERDGRTARAIRKRQPVGWMPLPEVPR